MPQIPQNGYGYNPVQDQALPTERVAPSASEEAFGGGASAERLNQGAEQVFDTGQKIAIQAREQADQLATTEANMKLTQLKNDLLYNPQKGMITRRGKDAFDVPEVFGADFNDGAQEITEGLSNDRQKQIFSRMVMSHKAEFDTELQKHVYSETKAYDDQTTEASLQTAVSDAVLNYQVPGKVQSAIETQRAVIQDKAARDGWSPDVVAQKMKEAESATHVQVISRMLDNDQFVEAKQQFDDNKDSLTGPDSAKVEKALESGEIMTKAKVIWNDVKGYSLPGGVPDEAKMRAAVMADDSLSPTKQIKVLEYVKARAGELIADKSRNDTARDRSFMNNIDTIKSSGGTLDDALKSAQKYSTDPYDLSVKENAARKLFSVGDTDDAKTVVALHEQIDNGTARSQDIDLAAKNQLVSSKTWIALREKYNKSVIDGKNPETNATWGRVRDIGVAQFGNDKPKLDAFMYDLRMNSADKSPDQLIKMANDKLKTDPNTQHTIPFLGWKFGGDPQYQSDVDKSGAVSTAMGKIQDDIGRDQVSAIGKGIMYQGKKAVTPADLNDFANQIGGYDKVQPGQPAHNAITSLMNKGMPVTPKNINAVLSKYPDGKY